MQYLLLTVLTIGILTAADPPTKDVLDNSIEPAKVAVPPVPQTVVYKDIKSLPVEAVRALDAFNREEARVRSEYEKKVETERKRLLAALDSAKASSTRNGKLEEALAVKAVIEKVTIDPQAQAVKSKVSQIAGNWRQNNQYSHTLFENGRINCLTNGIEGKWEIIENKLVITWDKSGIIDTYTINDLSSSIFHGVGHHGVLLEFVRIGK